MLAAGYTRCVTLGYHRDSMKLGVVHLSRGSIYPGIPITSGGPFISGVHLDFHAGGECRLTASTEADVGIRETKRRRRRQ